MTLVKSANHRIVERIEQFQFLFGEEIKTDETNTNIKIVMRNIKTLENADVCKFNSSQRFSISRNSVIFQNENQIDFEVFEFKINPFRHIKNFSTNKIHTQKSTKIKLCSLWILSRLLYANR